MRIILLKEFVMKVKSVAAKYIAVLLLAQVMSGALILSSSAKLDAHKMDSDEYILNHGHSKEMVRLINQQKRTVTAEEPNVRENNRFVKFFKNLFYERDMTLPTKDLGRHVISTPESPDR